MVEHGFSKDVHKFLRNNCHCAVPEPGSKDTNNIDANEHDQKNSDVTLNSEAHRHRFVSSVDIHWIRTSDNRFS